MVNESLIKGGRDRVSLLSFPHPSEKIPKGAFSNFIRHTEPSLAKAKVQALNRLVANKKNNAQVDVILLGGRRGIRTLERIAPLHTFQACQFNHSCTLPYIFYSTQFVLICSRRASIASLLRLLKKKIPSVLSF